MIDRLLIYRPVLLLSAIVLFLTIPDLGHAESTGESDDTIRLSFPPNVAVSILIDYVAQRLNINILYDDQVARTQVTLQSPAPVAADSLLPLLETILRTRGFALVDMEQPGWKRVVPLQALPQVATLQTGDPGAAAEAAVVTRMFQLEHLMPADVEALIRPVLTPQGSQMLADPGRQMLVITDFAQVLDRVQGLIEVMDRPGKPAAMEVIEARHISAAALAQDLIQSLNTLRSANGASGGSGRDVQVLPQERTNRVMLVGSVAGIASAKALAAEIDVDLQLTTKVFALRFADPERLDALAERLIDPLAAGRLYRATVDEDASLLVVTATDTILAQVASLADELDRPVVEASSPIRFYKLQNANAGEVLATIRSIETAAGNDALLAFAALDGDVAPPLAGAPLPVETSAAGLSGEPGVLGLGRDGQPPAVRGQGVTIAADENTNTLIVVGDPAAQRIYATLIERLDKRRPQVLIEATIVTVDTGNNASLGVEVRVGDDEGDDQTFAFSQFGLSQVDDGGRLDLIPGVGFNGAVLDADIADVVIRALKGDSRAQVVSAPKLLVNDNASGVIASVAEQPVTSINQGQNTDTVTFSEFVSAGTSITVTPRIAEGDYLRLKFDVSLESFQGEGSAGIPPPRQSNQVSSEVTIPDGATVVVGGINRRDLTESVSRIPLLGELPLLEYAFSSRSDSQSNSTLFIFLRPVILRDDLFEDLKYWSGRDLERAKELGIEGLPANADGFPESSTMSIR